MHRYLLILIYLIFQFCIAAASSVAAEPTRLTNDGHLKSDLVLSADRSKLIYSIQEKFNLIQLRAIDLESLESELVHPSANTSEFSYSPSKSGEVICFIRNDGNLHNAVVIENKKTSKSISHNPGGGFAAVRRATTSPDGSHVIFSFPTRDAEQQLWRLNVNGGEPIELTKGALDTYPRFSPNGSLIAFASTRSGNFDIHVMSKNGQGILQLTDNPTMDTRPAWSPDNKQIAFTSNREGNYDIYVIDADGTNERQVTTNTEKDDFAIWHPNGRQIFVVSERNGKNDLFLVNVD